MSGSGLVSEPGVKRDAQQKLPHESSAGKEKARIKRGGKKANMIIFEKNIHQN